MGWTLGALAERVGGEVVGDSERTVRAIRTLARAETEDLSFLTGPRHLEAARESRAGALLVGRRHAELAVDQLVVRDPRRALGVIVGLLHPEPAPAAGVHGSAVVEDGAEVDPTAHVGPFAVIGAGARIGPGALVHAHVVVGPGCEIGERAVLHPHVVLYRRTRIGAGTVVHAGTVLGADGFGYAPSDEGLQKIPQVGDVEIGAGVEIGALSAVDRAFLESTRIGDGAKIDNLVQVGHNADIGRAAVLCGQAGVAGSARIGDGAVLGGQAGIAEHLEIGDRAQVASKSAAYSSVPAGEVVAGIPAIPIAEWRRQQALSRRLARLWRRLRKLELRSGGSGDDEEEGS